MSETDQERIERIAAHMAADPEVQADIAHTEWHISSLTPFDGSCAQGCIARDAAEVLAPYLGEGSDSA